VAPRFVTKDLHPSLLLSLAFTTMGLFRPATPGFLVTLIATILLLVVSFSVPWFKNVYFLKAAVSEGNQSGFITFGVLGYCTSINNGTLNCTKAKLGYRFGQ
jgi:hypothetical protein